jgi:transcriptional regulator with XRE-family HTH domain
MLVGGYPLDKYPLSDMLAFMSDLAVAVGERIKSARVSLGITGAELARRAGIGVHVLWRYEHGQMLPGLENLVALARELGVSVDDLALKADTEPVIVSKAG